jgi:hypothetical protein
MKRKIDNQERMYPMPELSEQDARSQYQKSRLLKHDNGAFLEKIDRLIRLMPNHARDVDDADLIKVLADDVRKLQKIVGNLILPSGFVASIFDLGQLYEQLLASWRFEEHVVRGRRVEKGSNDGIAVRRTQSKGDTFLREIKSRIQKRGTRKNPSNTAIVKRAAEKCGLSERQAWRYWRAHSPQEK